MYPKRSLVIGTLVIFAILLMVLDAVNCFSTRADIKLKNNGYEGVVIAVGPDVPEDQALITNIKVS